MVIEDDELPVEVTRWMAIARVHTEKAYSQYWFYRNMRVAWDLAKEVKIWPLEENLYTLHFECLLRLELALDFPEEERMMQHSSVSISLSF